MDETGLVGYLAQQFRQLPREAINLLQGEFRAERPKSDHFKRWQGVLALAAGWALVALIGMMVQGFWAEREAQRLEDQSFAFYQELFPRESQPVGVDQLRRRMAAKLGQQTTSGEASDFMGLVAAMADALAASDQVTSLSYAEQRRELNVEVLLNNYDQIDTLKETLAKAGVAMDTANAEQEGGKVRSRLKVRYAS